MKKLIQRLFALCLGLVLLMQGNASLLAQAFSSDEVQMITHIVDEKDEFGNYVPEYYVDQYGNRVELDQPSVSAQADLELPEEYDARDYGYITPVKNQAGAGSCWAFANIACAEANYIKKGYGTAGNTDFSEAHLVWFGQRGRYPAEGDPTYGDGRNASNPFTLGGHWLVSSSALMRGSGLQLEKNARWTETWTESTMLNKMKQPESARYVSAARLTHAHTIKGNGIEERDEIKSNIMRYGAVQVSYYEDSGLEDVGFNYLYDAYFQTNKIGTNHAVTIVGWDDNFSRTKFNANSRPGVDGAWLIKGSWGTGHGNLGYYWISYDEPSLDRFTCYEVEKGDLCDHIYQYDGSYPEGSYAVSTGTAAIANTFTAERFESIRAVAFYSENVRADVTADIYVSNTKPSFSKNDPTAGMTLVPGSTTTVKNVESGYSTMELVKPVHLSPGQYFTVKLTFKAAGIVYVSYEGVNKTAVTESENAHTAKSKQSFAFLGKNWIDTTNYLGISLNNVPVKALTVDRTPVEPSLSIQTMPNKTRFDPGENFDLTGLSLLYTDNAGEQYVIENGYTLDKTKADTEGKYTVTVTYAGLQCTLDLTVQYVEELLLDALPDKLVYAPGEMLDLTGLRVRYTDGVGGSFALSDGYTVSAPDLRTPGLFPVTLTYKGKQAAFHISVEIPATLTIVTPPDKTAYTLGETLDLTGMKVEYSSRYGEKETVDLQSLNGTVLDHPGRAVPLLITHEGLTCTFTVEVTTTAELIVAQMPTKTKYYVGETRDLAGLVLQYSNTYGEVTEVTSGYTVRAASMSSVGEKTIQITYNGATCSFSVHVYSRPVLRVVTMPTKTNYKLGQKPDLSGLWLSYIDCDGETQIVTTGFTTDNKPLSLTGANTVTVRYGVMSCTITLTVVGRSGDANGDDVVNLKDAVLISRFVVGGYDVSLSEICADVNNDGAVNLMDVALIRRFLVGGYGVVLA